MTRNRQQPYPGRTAEPLRRRELFFRRRVRVRGNNFSSGSGLLARPLLLLLLQRFRRRLDRFRECFQRHRGAVSFQQLRKHFRRRFFVRGRLEAFHGLDRRRHLRSYDLPPFSGTGRKVIEQRFFFLQDFLFLVVAFGGRTTRLCFSLASRRYCCMFQSGQAP